MGGCFPCFRSSKKEGSDVKEVTKDSVKEGSATQSHHVTRVSSVSNIVLSVDEVFCSFVIVEYKSKSRSGSDSKKEPPIPKDGPTAHIAAQTFTFRELAAATKNFRPESLLGEGGFGRVYKGRLESTGQVVAVKQLDRNGLQGNREFLVEVLMLSLLHHPNLVNLIGYCADGDQRLLVYEFMPLGSLEDHLHVGLYLDLPPDREPLDWNTRMKIAAAPGEHNLVAWARPLFKDRRKFPKMADPLLQGRYPMRGLYQALAVAAMCLQEQAATRPLIGDVVTALTYLASQTYDPNAVSSHSNRVGPSTPRNRDDRRNMADGLDSPDEHGRGGRHGSPATHRNSPDFRRRDPARELSTGAELGRIETGGGSGRKWGVDESEQHESQRDSPLSTGRAREIPRNRDLDRERAVAEAKVWGENWREKKRANAMGSFDGTNEYIILESWFFDIRKPREISGLVSSNFDYCCLSYVILVVKELNAWNFYYGKKKTQESQDDV
ncbi:hypothetical protein FEM48_Zijuj12G0184400 [Ziziphus jujuba var. spinosa]|uniref:Protein kinase domain-containing protein n=1 Tax=Ziziphus jujuba var. spinosa TaxID=714518 RepID=A0A978UEU6_ZIZJJ|nr:hypothetical protein FEM48_Zijuj12G0184400 [Ziziphus jujuba var. spinosa]